MGKKRITIVGEEAPKKEKEKKVIKAGKGEGRVTDMGEVALAEAEKVAEKIKKAEKEAEKSALEEIKKAPVLRKKRGRRYLNAKMKVDRNKNYSIKEAVRLVKETSISRFPGTVSLDMVTTETGLSGQIGLPYPTGKKARVAIADDKLLEKIKKGKIDFDVLIAAPAMMGKLAPLARILGPKGLMPNPKKGTISDNPEKTAKEMQGNVPYSTEKKAPLIHLVVGKTDQDDKELAANIKTALVKIGAKNLTKVVLAATMSLGVKIDLAEI